MSARTLFIIVLRILGILSVRTAILALFQSIGSLFLLGSLTHESILYSNIVSNVVVTGVFFGVSWALIFKAGYIVDRFKLAQDMTPVLQFRIDIRDALRIALVVTGAILLVYELPTLISNIAEKLDAGEPVLFSDGNTVTWRPAILSAIRVVIALLIIGERKRILDVLLKDPANNPTDADLQERVSEDENKDLFPDQH